METTIDERLDQTIHVAVVEADIQNASRFRSRGCDLAECCPLVVALRRLGWSPTLTRRYVLSEGRIWEPSVKTRCRENTWAETGRASPYLAELRRKHLRQPKAPRLEPVLIDRQVDFVARDRRNIDTWLQRFANHPE